jgi:heterogeneous nuclear rnp K-like protein 2
LIATTLLATSGPDNNDHQAPVPSSDYTSIKLLVPHSQMGSIIGKAGAKIKQIQDASGARMVASKEMLPQSTERTVEISGSPVSIGTAVRDIAACLLGDAERLAGTIYYTPGTLGTDAMSNPAGGSFAAGTGTAQSPAYPQQPSVSPSANRRPSEGPPSARPAYAPPSPQQSAQPRPDRRTYSNSYNQPNGGAPPQERSRLIAGLEPEDPNLRTQNISFPGDMIGCIIVRSPVGRWCC